MKLTIVLATLLALASCAANAADQDSIQARRETVQTRVLAGENAPLSRPQLMGFCSTQDSVQWCEGFIAAILTVYQIPRECLPRTDMARFMNGQVWELTSEWLHRQAQDSKHSFFDAVTSALAEQQRCPMGALLPYMGSELVPYSEAELEEMRYLMNPTPLEEVTPTYPPSARRDGIEGWTQVSFTMTENGDVKDIVIVDSDPAQIFDAASIEAASKFKLRPILRGGIAIEVPNLQHVFRFSLEQD
tara:strand:+ start:1574 stop:2311 length:738 start_codon:yes stop_codon:yes gene_type:complete